MRVWGRHQVDEGRDSPALHHSRGLIRSARGNVGKRPGCLELDRRALVHRQEADKPLNEAGIDDAVNRWVLLTGQQLPVKCR